MAICSLLAPGLAGAATKINIGIVTNPDFVHVRAGNRFREEVEKKLPGTGKSSSRPPATPRFSAAPSSATTRRSSLNDLKQKGMLVEENPDIEAFREKTAPVVDTVSGETKKLVMQIRQELQ